MSSFINTMLQNNRDWAEQKLKEDKDYFENMSKGQKPPVLWIGCADSRVPASEITGSHAGDLFVHRNIANLVVHTDINIMSVLEYAVNQLKVKDIVICGHYGCGGVQAAMSHNHLGIINKWVRNIKDVYRIHQKELEFISDPDKRFDRLVELNVVEQFKDLVETSIVQKAWADGQELHVHGWVYDMKSGLVNDLGISMKDNSQIDEIYRYENF
jgi:carbonic anhydrase